MDNAEQRFWQLARRWLAESDPQSLVSGLPGHPHGWIPPSDVYETADELVVVVEVPGVRAEDVQAVLEEQALMIRGRRRQPCREDGARYLRKEIGCGSFVVVVPLPYSVDPEHGRGVVEEGFLTVRLRRKAGSTVVRRVVVRMM